MKTVRIGLGLLALACANPVSPKPQPTVFLLNRGPYQVYLSWQDSAGVILTDTVAAGQSVCEGFPANVDSAYWTASDGSQLYGANYQRAGQAPSWRVAYNIQPPNVIYTFQVLQSNACPPDPL